MFLSNGAHNGIKIPSYLFYKYYFTKIQQYLLHVTVYFLIRQCQQIHFVVLKGIYECTEFS